MASTSNSIPVVNDNDKRWGIIASVVFMALIALYMFLFYFVVPDPPPTNPPLRAEAIFEDIVMEELQVQAGGAGGGEPSDAEVKPPQPQVQEVLTNPESQTTVPSGQSSQTNTNQPSDNSSSTTQQSSNPFGGGDGGGEGGGSGDTFGSDSGKEGSGGGPSTASGAGRVRYNEISTDEIYTSSTVVVKLILTIDEHGRVVDARCLTSQTTTTDQRIINQVIYAARTQLKYNPEPGAGLQSVYYTAKVVPN